MRREEGGGRTEEQVVDYEPSVDLSSELSEYLDIPVNSLLVQGSLGHRQGREVGALDRGAVQIRLSEAN